MGRGILTGLIWGAIVGFGILTVANEVVAPVSLTRVETPAEVMTESLPETPEVASGASGDTAEEMAPETSAETAMAAPEAPEIPDASAEVTPEAPAAEPDRSGAQPDVATPDMGSDPSPEADTKVASAPEIETPVAPVAPKGADGLGEVSVPETSPVLTPPQAVAPQADTSEGLPQTEEALPTPQVPEGTDAAPMAPVPPESEEKSTLDTAEIEAAPGQTIETGPEVERMDSLLEPKGEVLPGQKVGSFTDRTDSRVSSRLPSISSKPAEEAEAPVVVADDLPALLAYSADYTAKPLGPVMSVILVDIAKLGPEDAELSNLPFPVTFAVDALAAQAGERAMEYRDKGLEVLSMISLPEGATPQDAAVTMSQAAELVPVSIGFLDVPSASFQTSRQVAAQVVATAQESGRGIVTFPRGLNALEQEAKRAKAPAALVFRDFDGRSQDVEAMKRFLDQAAFQAGAGKTVVLLGRSKPDTIQALAEWSLGNRAATVTMVPLSYLLSRSQL